MQRAVRPICRAVKKTTPNRILGRAKFSTEAPPAGVPPPPHGNGGPNHYHYYYGKHHGQRRMWFWTIGAGVLGYWLTSASSRQDCWRRRRVERAYDEMKETHKVIKNEVDRIQERLGQLRLAGPFPPRYG
ncbi:hypothetical protein AC1031_022037 [Aphanomyces cochlioides]|nr:hypothetical protein AC1031_022037 [Aphanomyces cochlioides]